MSDIQIYQSQDGEAQVEVQFDKETVWLNKQQLSMLFDRDRTVITRHINNIFKEGELLREEVCADFAHTTQHGAMSGKTQSRTMEFYNLDVIISVGYRVKSKRGTQFRIWATQRLKDYLVQGYAINEHRQTPHHQHPQPKSGQLMIKRSDNPTLPDDWTECRLEQACGIHNNLRHARRVSHIGFVSPTLCFYCHCQV